MRRAGRRQDTASVQAYFEADIHFHLTVAQMTGNAVYLHLLHFLTELIRKSLTISRELLDEGFTQANTDRHKAVFDSVAKGDAAGAGSAMAEHFAFVEKRVATGRPQPGKRDTDNRPMRAVRPNGRRSRKGGANNNA